MKLILQQLPSHIRCDSTNKLLAPSAAESLLRLEENTGGIYYKDMWRDAVSSLVARRIKQCAHLPGYSPHNYGIGITIDIDTTLAQKNINYQQLLSILKKEGWVCYRKDEVVNAPGSDQFSFLGPTYKQYLTKCTLDPKTWDIPVETFIFERYGVNFQLSTLSVQKLLHKIGMYCLTDFSGTNDLYTREAIMAFQRAWGLTENGHIDSTLCRVLVFITMDLEVRSGP